MFNTNTLGDYILGFGKSSLYILICSKQLKCGMRTSYLLLLDKWLLSLVIAVSVFGNVTAIALQSKYPFMTIMSAICYLNHRKELLDFWMQRKNRKLFRLLNSIYFIFFLQFCYWVSVFVIDAIWLIIKYYIFLCVATQGAKTQNKHNIW